MYTALCASLNGSRKSLVTGKELDLYEAYVKVLLQWNDDTRICIFYTRRIFHILLAAGQQVRKQNWCQNHLG